MRISTAQFFQQGISSIQSKQAELSQTQMQLSSGLRIMKPSDDPSGSVKVLNLQSNIDVIDQYSRNIAVAESSLGFQESVMENINLTLHRIRELSVQGNNSSNSDQDRESIASEIYQRLDELLALANTRNASGEYIFGGNRVDSPPFLDNNGVIEYSGDQGQRSIQIGQGAQVMIRDSGEQIFQRIPGGDGNIQVLPDSSNTGSAIIGKFGLNGNFIQDDYTVTFTQAAPDDPVTYTVTDSASPVPNVISSGTYNDGGSISFAGAQFVLNGSPDNGDIIHISPSQNQDIFGTVQAIADALGTASPDQAANARFHNAMGAGLANLDQALDKINSVRASIGARMNNVSTLDNVNQDFKLQLQTVLSDTQDLDYAEAISRFNLQLTALQAAQETFVKTSGLSIFQYL